MKRLQPFLLAVASGLLMALALPLVVPFLSIHEVDPQGRLEVVAWVALVPLLFAVEQAPRARRAFALGFVGGLAYFFAAIYWVSHAMTAFGGLPLWLSLVALTLLVAFMAAHWGGALAVAWWIRRRLGWPLWALMPPVWTAFELLRNYSLSGFPWGNLGYTQARGPVAQLAAVTGVYGIAALVVLVNAIVFDAGQAVIEGRVRPEEMGWRRFPPRHGFAVLAILVLAFGGGDLRRDALEREMAAAAKVKVGIVQANVDQSIKNSRAEHVEEILGRLVPRTQEADAAGAELVAWPEAAYPMYVPPTLRTFALPGARLPRLDRAHLLIGATTLERAYDQGPAARRVTNSAFLVAPSLEVVGRHAKEHLVPFGEYVPFGRYLTFLRHVVPSFAPISTTTASGSGKPVRYQK